MYYDQITEFVFQEDQPEESTCLVIPGSGYGELAEKAAELYQRGYTRKIIVSGKYSILQETFAGAVSPAQYRKQKYATESDFLKAVLLDHGVKEEDIWQEKRATFTYENAIYTRILLDEKGILPEKIMLVCQAFHSARSRMYFQYVFPESKILVCPAVTQRIDRRNWYQTEKGIRTVLGEVERMGTQFTDMMLGKDKVSRSVRQNRPEK